MLAFLLALVGMDMSDHEEKPSRKSGESQQSDSSFPFKTPKKLKGLFENQETFECILNQKPGPGAYFGVRGPDIDHQVA